MSLAIIKDTRTAKELEVACCLSCMRGNFHVQFLGEEGTAMSSPYPIIGRLLWLELDLRQGNLTEEEYLERKALLESWKVW